ncbi:MAG TPA: efflux RND transporter periplasmic adaptor subunit [Vicinamibacterales bacterium]|nr:efflux RND transporter periplasmic adaptor subunit [Vicinamibacterales bacterium]
MSRTLYLVAGAIVIAAATITVLAWPRLVAHPVTTTVKASGRIEGRDVTVAPKGIQGRIARLLVDEGDTVKKGQLLAELDVPQIEAQHEAASGSVAALDAQIAQASLDVIYTTKNSEASIAAAAAGLTSAQASVLRANAVLTNAKATYDRAVALFAAKAMSKQELDLAEMALHTSEADVAAAEKEVVRSEAALALARASADTIGLKRQQLRALQASRRSAAGRLAEAEANLAERRIIAPIDGTILSRPVEVGAVVGQGTAVFQMVDMNRLYVKVYIPEPEIAKLKLGDRADVSVDAFPGRVFAARISKIHDQAEFTPKNVETTDERLKLVFGVELTFVTPDRLLKPGMPADCIIHWTSSSTGESGHGS